jgi:hypothetical protein
VALDHVHEGAGVVVVAGAALDPERPVEDHVDALDVPGVEHGMVGGQAGGQHPRSVP